jgi:hypothetical protein
MPNVDFYQATDKIRSFLLDKTKSLQLPNANIPIIQQTVLLKYKSLNHFVIQRHSEVAMEIRQTYTQIMNNYIQSKFAKYISKLQKLQSVIADKYDLIGLDDNAKKSKLYDFN